MKYGSIRNLSLQKMQIFLKAMEFGSFTQVARYYNFSVPMISKTISSLEQELGLILFVKKSHTMYPTPAAKILASEWNNIVATVEQSVEKAHIVQKGKMASVNVGFVDSSENTDTKFRQVFAEYERRNPRADIKIEKYDLHGLLEKLNVGALDLVLTAGYEIPTVEAYQLPWKKLFGTNSAIYIPKTCELFSKEDIRFSDFTGEKFIILSPMQHANYYAHFNAMCRKYGFRPKVETSFPNVSSLLCNLRAGKGCVLGDAITVDWADHEEVRMFPLPEESATILCWRKNVGEDILELVSYICEVYHVENG